MSESQARLVHGPVWLAVFRLAGPMILAIIAVLAVSLVDAYFVGKLGTEELAAISFAFPVSLSITSLSIGLGAGTSSVVSRYLGASDRKQAVRASTDSLSLSLVLILTISTIGYIYTEELFSLLGAKGITLQNVTDYMRIWFISMPLLVIPMVASSILRANGDALWPTLIMVASSVVNVIATPALIFGYGPFPELAIEGAAYGTLIAHVASLLIAIYVAVFREKIVCFEWRGIACMIKSWKEIIRIGVPAALGNMVNPVGITFVTALVAGLGAVVVAGFGVATRVESFSVIPMLALSASIGPVAGQNWGAGRIDRSFGALSLCYGISVVWSVVIAGIFWIAGEPIASVFASEPAVAKEASLYLTWVPLTLFGYGITICAAAALNSIGKPYTGLLYYFVRTAALYVPLAWLASMLFGSRAVFQAIAISNAVAGVIIFFATKRFFSEAIVEQQQKLR